MEGRKDTVTAGRTLRFRIASANSGRVLAEVFKEDRWCSSASGSFDSDSSPEGERGPVSEANGHLNGLLPETAGEESGGEPDDLLLYASAKRHTAYSNKRINICSKNGTVRGVAHKVSAGQVLFNNICSGASRHPKRRPWEKQ